MTVIGNGHYVTNDNHIDVCYHKILKVAFQKKKQMVAKKLYTQEQHPRLSSFIFLQGTRFFLLQDRTRTFWFVRVFSNHYTTQSLVVERRTRSFYINILNLFLIPIAHTLSPISPVFIIINLCAHSSRKHIRK